LALAAAAIARPVRLRRPQGQDLSDDPTTDDGIAAIAASRLNSDPMTARAVLSVTVDNGLAILYGTVPTKPSASAPSKSSKARRASSTSSTETRRR
jgi:hypothetical protein